MISMLMIFFPYCFEACSKYFCTYIWVHTYVIILWYVCRYICSYVVNPPRAHVPTRQTFPAFLSQLYFLWLNKLKGLRWACVCLFPCTYYTVYYYYVQLQCRSACWPWWDNHERWELEIESDYKYKEVDYVELTRVVLGSVDLADVLRSLLATVELMSAFSTSVVSRWLLGP